MRKVANFIEKHIALFTAYILVVLAHTALYGRSHVMTIFEEELYVPLDAQAFIFILGAVVLAVRKGYIAFAIGTLPYAIYMLSTFYLTYARLHAGYQTAWIQLWAYLMLWVLYQDGDRHGH